MCMGMGGDAGICCLTLKLNVGEMASSIYSTAWSSAKILADAKDWTVLATFGKFEPSTPINVDCSTFNLSTGLGLGPSFASKSDCHLPNYLVGMYECGPVYIRLLFRQPAT